MLTRIVVICWLNLLPTVAAMGQAVSPPAAPSAAGQELQPTPPAVPAPEAQPQPGRVLCDQNVTYRLVDPSSMPEQYRQLVGIWSDAAWDTRTCAALIVQDVKPDGSASIIYVYGPLGSGAPAQGAVLHGTGVVRGGELRFQNSDGSQFAFRPGIADLTGHWINPKGESFQATFKQTP